MIRELGSGIDIFLQPGEWYFAGAETGLRTTLGSCVAVTLWHPHRRIGGMCHYMLPARKGESVQPDGRYADEALQLLAGEIRRHNTALTDYQVKLFGGANMFVKCGGTLSVADHNVLVARAWVEEQGLPIAAESLGGFTHRQLIFDINTGNVWVRHGVKPTCPLAAGN